MNINQYRKQLDEALQKIGSKATVISFADDLPPYEVRYVETCVDDTVYTHDVDDLSAETIDNIVYDVRRAKSLDATLTSRNRALDLAKAIVDRRSNDLEIERLLHKITRLVISLRLANQHIYDDDIIDVIMSLSFRDLALVPVTQLTAMMIERYKSAA